MRIKLKLFASLTDYLPDSARASRELELEVPEGATVARVIEPLHLPPKLVHLVLVNGMYVSPAQRATYAFRDGDTLAIWPPVAGG